MDTPQTPETGEAQAPEPPPRPTIRYLTPADYPDMCDILDQHTSGQGAYCNDPSQPASPDFHQNAKNWIDWLFSQPMAHFFGYVDEQGRIGAFCCFIRWGNNDDMTISIKVENTLLNLPRAPGARWSDAMIDVVNWGVGFFWSEGVSRFWTLNFVGQDAASYTAHPNCILNQYQREKVLDIPAGQPAPKEYERVHWKPMFQDTQMFKYTDPLPLDEYLKVKNDPTGDAG